MNIVADQIASLIAGIEPAGLAALRVGFTFAVIVFLLAGVFIFRRRHQLFDRDPKKSVATSGSGWK
jgi:hypothetical protein